MADNSQWEFLLIGDSQEFRNLAQKRGTRLFDIRGGVDDWLDCPNDDFRMTTLYCDEHNDAKIAWQVGAELVSLFNGASVLFKREYNRASIYKLLSSGCEAPSPREVGPAVPALLGHPKCSPEELREECKQAKKLGVKFHLLNLATFNEDVYFILKYFAMEPDWATYANILQTIDTFAKRHPFKSPLTSSERNRFGATVNNFSMSGFNSRHGFMELAKKKFSHPPFSINEGYDIVAREAISYLNSKYLFR